MICGRLKAFSISVSLRYEKLKQAGLPQQDLTYCKESVNHLLVQRTVMIKFKIVQTQRNLKGIHFLSFVNVVSQ